MFAKSRCAKIECAKFKLAREFHELMYIVGHIFFKSANGSNQLNTTETIKIAVNQKKANITIN